MFPDIPHRWSLVPTDIINGLAALLRQIILPENQGTPPTAKEIVAKLYLTARMRSEQSEELYLMDRHYKVERILGQGAMARTYLATYADFAEADLGFCVSNNYFGQKKTLLKLSRNITHSKNSRVNTYRLSWISFGPRMRYILKWNTFQG